MQTCPRGGNLESCRPRKASFPVDYFKEVKDWGISGSQTAIPATAMRSRPVDEGGLRFSRSGSSFESGQGLLRLHSRWDRSAAHRRPLSRGSNRAARQLLDQSATLRAGSSSTDDSRLRGALPPADSARSHHLNHVSRRLVGVLDSGRQFLLFGRLRERAVADATPDSVWHRRHVDVADAVMRERIHHRVGDRCR